MKKLISLLLLTSCATVQATELKTDPMPYCYHAYVKRVIDGDTFEANLRVTFDLVLTDQRFRLLRVNTPELKGEQRPEGLKALAYVETRLPQGLQVTVCTKAKDAFGRWLVEVFLDGENFSDELLKKKIGKPYDK